MTDAIVQEVETAATDVTKDVTGEVVNVAEGVANDAEKAATEVVDKSEGVLKDAEEVAVKVYDEAKAAAEAGLTDLGDLTKAGEVEVKKVVTDVEDALVNVRAAIEQIAKSAWNEGGTLLTKLKTAEASLVKHIESL